MSHLAWLILIIGWLVFVLYYASSFFKWGVLTFSSYFWIRYNVLPILIMSPFASSDRNMEAVGDAIYIIRDYINEAFYLSILGVVFLMVGMALATFSSGKSAVFTFVEKGYAFWQTRAGVWISLIVIILATIGLIGLGVRPFAGRQFSFENTSLRPAINLYSVILPTITLSLLVYGFGHSRFFVFAGFMCSALGLMIGTRGASIEVLFIFVVCLIITYRYKNLAAFTLAIAGFVTIGIAIGIIRSTSEGNETVDILQVVSYQIFYGNNFSDFRDYAWILSGFNDQFYNGMTYLAGYMALIPSFISEFRNEFRTGIITTTLAGLDPQFHAGLRPTLFGEAYLNFGVPGVIFAATLFGFYFGKLQMWVHSDLPRNRFGLRRVACAYIVLLFMFNAVFTPGFYYVYVVVAWLVGGMIMSYLFDRPASGTITQPSRA